MRYTYRKPYTPLEERKIGVKCDECSLEVDDPAGNLPCPNCGSTLRRLPREWGQAVADTIDVSERDS